MLQSYGMKRVILIVVFFQVCSGLLVAQEKLYLFDSILNERGEVYVFAPQNRLKSTTLQAISYRIDHQRNDSIFMYLGKNDRKYILSELDNLEILTAPSQKFQVKMASGIDEVLSGTAYPTYSQYLEIMQMFRDSFPEICSVDTVGESTNGRLLLAARLGTSSKSLYELPRVLLSSTIHGDEVLGYSMMLLLLNELLENSQSAEVVDLLDRLNLFIIPLTNPDGTYFISNETVSGARRFNANGIDLNRNFPDPSSGDHPWGESWQKETIALMSFLDSIRPNLSANYHGGSEVVNYPFDTWSALHADDDWFRLISREYADTAMHYFPGYMSSSEFDNGITNGYAWYSVDGGMQDYVTWFLRGRELTIEISNIKTPPEAAILTYWNANRNSMVNLIRQALYGIGGKVIDDKMNIPIQAEIIIPDHDKLNSEVFSDSINGYYYRPLISGIYDIKISAEGYNSKIIYHVEIADYHFHELNVGLSKSSDDTIAFSVNYGPNPFDQNLNLIISTPNDNTCYFRVYSISGKLVFEDKQFLPKGNNKTELELNLQSNGLYILEISSKDFTKKFRIIHQKGQ